MSVEENKEFKEEELESDEAVESAQTNEKTDSDEQQAEEITEEEHIEDDKAVDEEIDLEEKINQLEQEKKELEDENQQLQEKVDDFQKKHQRLKADFVNYRKRTQKEKDGLGLQAQIELLEEILPAIDNFERALLTADEESEFKEGIELIYKQLFNALKQLGLEKIEGKGCPFDHKYHEAIMQVEDSEVESGTVVEELQTGYMYNGKVIRPAMVKVAQ